MAEPYIAAHPGDLISADDHNRLQVLIREDIDGTVKKAIKEIQQVPRAGDADKLEGTSKTELIDQIVARAVAEVRAKSSYLQIFKVLNVGKEEVVKHDLHLSPLVDVYQLDYFPVVCCEDKETSAAWVTFYLFHESEKRLHFGTPRTAFEIQPADGQPFRIAFADLLSRYKVEFTDDSSLGDLETEFWQAFFKDPNDEFSDDQHCHSPWFDRCCREEKTVRDLKRQGDWDELYLQMRPRKTVNYPIPIPAELPEITPAPTQIQVAQFDFDTIGVTLLQKPVYPKSVLERTEPPGPIKNQFPDIEDELKVMLLLKV